MLNHYVFKFVENDNGQNLILKIILLERMAKSIHVILYKLSKTLLIH